jgi:glycosyltransferase involved in cell wall biosynthesis
MGGTLRILCVNPGVHLGGAEQSLLLLLERLQTERVAATVVLFGPGQFHDRLATLGIPAVTLAPSRRVRGVSRYGAAQTLLQTGALAGVSLASAVALARITRRVGADIIHTNGLKAHVLGGVAGRLIGVPVVWHLRDFPPSGSFGNVVRRCAAILPSMVLANSDAVAAAIGSSAGGRVRRVYNPVDLRKFNPEVSRERLRRELGITGDIPVIGLVAHLTPWKGHDRFLRISRAVADRVPTCRFIVAGGSIYESDGHAGYREALLNQMASLGLADRVSWLGPRDDMPDVLAALDVLVHCPDAPEPFGRAIAEAMAMGRPVVAARSGGIPEIVDHGRCGLLVAPGDVEAFASAVVRLLNDPELGRRFGTEGRGRAERLFDPALHARSVMDVYQAVLSPGQSTA